MTPDRLGELPHHQRRQADRDDPQQHPPTGVAAIAAARPSCPPAPARRTGPGSPARREQVHRPVGDQTDPPEPLHRLLSATSWAASGTARRADERTRRTSWADAAECPNPPGLLPASPVSGGGDGGAAQHDVTGGVGAVEGDGLARGDPAPARPASTRSRPSTGPRWRRPRRRARAAGPRTRTGRPAARRPRHTTRSASTVRTSSAAAGPDPDGAAAPARCRARSAAGRRRPGASTPSPLRWPTVNPWTPSWRASSSPVSASTTAPGRAPSRSPGRPGCRRPG